MMMQNNEQNKKRFFAQYWGSCYVQYCFRDGIFEEELVGSEYSVVEVVESHEDSILVLKSLEKLTKEDALELCELVVPKYKGTIKEIKIDNTPERVRISVYDDFGLFVEVNGDGVFYKNWSDVKLGCRNIDGLDFLRRKGYAITWNGVEVKELKRRNWLKFEEDAEQSTR